MKVSEGVLSAFVHAFVFSIVVISVLAFIINYRLLIGPVLICLAFLPWLPIKFSGRKIKSTAADIVFGVIDTGILTIAALIGANFAGVLGAIVGGAAGDAITDSFAGIFEGRVAIWLRKKGIKEARTPLSSAMGKMSGCLFGVGIVLTIAWSLLVL
ncbi:MAG: hypothetical protein QMD14_00255 [Candidatus Aenigmarchaeota archaeon]|nr:hypothetical protein [Candidatus Aenigmarchaeota archaeon]